MQEFDLVKDWVKVEKQNSTIIKLCCFVLLDKRFGTILRFKTENRC
jgi:hypothetical protein